MKKAIFALVAAVLFSTAAIAQDKVNQGKRPERKFDKTEMVKKRTDDQVKRYGLNDSQAKQLLALNTKYADKMGRPGHGPRGHHGEGRPMPPRDFKHGKDSLQKRAPKRPELTEEQKAKMDAERKQQMETMKAYDAELQKIMTKEQYEQYKADRQKRGPQGPRGQRGERGPRK